MAIGRKLTNVTVVNEGIVYAADLTVSAQDVQNSSITNKAQDLSQQVTSQFDRQHRKFRV